MRTDPRSDVDTQHHGEESIPDALARHGVSRRSFLTFCSAVAGALALPQTYAPQIAHALENAPRVPVIWLNGQDCNGNIEALIRTSAPTPVELLLDHLSVNYLELLSAGAGHAAEQALHDTIKAGGYVLVVEGGIPTAANGAYCTVGGRAFTDIVREAAASAAQVISVGTCASWGGVPAAKGGVTGAVDLQTFLGTSRKIIRLPGCPVNGMNIVGTIVHFLTFKEWPATNQQGLPLFAYGEVLHDQCPRKKHYDAEEYVKQWGDEGHRKGWCLIEMGCRGPSTEVNCRSKMFNSGTSYPIASGAPCFGCVNPGFWDADGALIPLPGSPAPSARRQLTLTPVRTAPRP